MTRVNRIEIGHIALKEQISIIVRRSFDFRLNKHLYYTLFIIYVHDN